MKRLSLAAPAKINLHLEILGRRSDGFHEIETVFQTIGLADTVAVAVEPGDGITLACDDPALPVDAGNLAWRAANAYQAAHPIPGRIAISLTKRIPAGAGLGGGSADAAAVLVALDRLHGDALGHAALERLAASLGSDIAFLVRGGTAHATGRGEVLTALPDLPDLPITIVMPPGAHCATPAVYRELTDAERGPRQALGAAWFAAHPLADWPHNRLTAPACRVCPAVADSLAAVPGAVMTGSGAASFVMGHPPIPSHLRAWRTRLRPAGDRRHD
jgi:4-diphosphocytidyl-2-C-methyl-D-erythritol kinase